LTAKAFSRSRDLHAYIFCDLFMFYCAGDETHNTNSSGMDTV